MELPARSDQMNGSEGGELAARLASIALVPVIEIPDPQLAGPLADALLAAGLPCAEITFRTPGAAAAIRAIAQRHPGMLVGAGTVLSPDQVDQALDAGARFLVSPGFSPAVVSHALDRGAVMLPGACTPTEVEMARAAGIELVKFFPAEPAGGVPYLQALTAPYPSLRFVPTGGIDARNAASYLAIGQVIAVGGSWMAPRSLIAGREFGAITQRARDAVALIRRLRAGPAAADPPNT